MARARSARPPTRARQAAAWRVASGSSAVHQRAGGLPGVREAEQLGVQAVVDPHEWHRGEQAERRIAAGGGAREVGGVGLDGFELYKTRVEQTGEIFYVPEGERYYYFALVEEALGLDTSALAHWDQFLASGAYPQYAARAKANRAAVAGRIAASASRVITPGVRRHGGR